MYAPEVPRIIQVMISVLKEGWTFSLSISFIPAWSKKSSRHQLDELFHLLEEPKHSAKQQI